MSQLLQTIFLNIVQAGVSAFFALFFGFMGALGLFSLHPRPKVLRWVYALFYVPNAIPVIFTLYSVLSFFPNLRGIFGIAFVHVLINVGLVAVTLHSLMLSQIGRMTELAWIEGAGRWLFLRAAVFGFLRSELWRLFFFVFVICFMSFSIPLILGGTQATTLEILIYQKIHSSGSWAQAIWLSVLQMILVLAFSLMIRRRGFAISAQVCSSELLAWRPGLWIAAAPSVFLVFRVLQVLGTHDAMHTVADIPNELYFGSALIAIGVGLLCLTLLLIYSILPSTHFLRRVGYGIVAPSSAIIGFAILWLWRSLGVASYFKIILATGLVTTPILIRLSWDARVTSLNSQIEIARTLGASRLLIFARIILPQTVQAAFGLAGLAAFWAFADFALPSLIAEGEITLPQRMQYFLETYRWTQAEALIFPLLLGSFLCFVVFAGAGYVSSRKSTS